MLELITLSSQSKSIKVFQLKQFAIRQTHTAMKVGTDGLLLGAYLADKLGNKAEDKLSILDVGSGTGLIALMLAQKLATAQLDALEIDNEAIKDTAYNIQNSPFAERISLLHSDFLQHTFTRTYDIIVSNPPYFQSTTLGSGNFSRAIARTEGKAGLTLSKLMAKAKSLFRNESSQLVLITPDDREYDLRRYATELNLRPVELCYVYSKAGKLIRLLSIWQSLDISSPYQETLIKELVLKDSSNHYTSLIQELYQDYLL